MSEAYVIYSEARSAAGRGSDSLKRARPIEVLHWSRDSESLGVGSVVVQ